MRSTTMLSLATLSLLGLRFAAPCAPVTGVTVVGDTVRVSIGSATFEAVPVSASMVECCYYTAALRGARTDMVSPAYGASAHFSSVQTTGDPIVLTSPACRLEVTRADFSVRFFDQAGRELFRTRGGAEGFWQDASVKKIQADVIKGPYYGIQTKDRQLNQWYGTGPVEAGDQGHAGGPFIWTTQGFGFLADNGGGQLNFWDNDATRCYLQSEKPSTDATRLFFLMAGTPRDILRSYHTVCGFPPMPPLWALGFLHSEWGQTESTIMTRKLGYRQRDIPLDAFILDFDWLDWGNADGEFKWNTATFPHAMSGVLADTMDASGIRLMGIRKPRIHTATPAGTYCDGQGWFVGKFTDYFSGREVGNLNFDIPAVRAWFWQKFIDPAYNSYERGITSYWNDEGGYGNFQNMHWQQGQYEGQRAMNSERVFSLNRSYFCGGQRYAYGLWSGDIGTGFDVMAAQRPLMLTSTCLGADWWSMDIGGFNGHPTDENYLRWMQMGAFVPIYRVHSNHDNRTPWVYGAEAEAVCTEFIRLRYQLLPYLYSAFWKEHTEGLPPVRPLLMDAPADANTANEYRCWMFGPDMVVAPITTQDATSASFYLPAGEWVSYWSDSVVTGGREVSVATGRSRIPLLVRRGAVVAMRPWGRSTMDSAGLAELRLHVYGGASGAADYYEDDFQTYGYEGGQYSVAPLAHASSATQELVTVGSRQGSYVPRQRSGLFVFHGRTSQPLAVARNSVAVSFADSAAFNQAQAPAWTWWPSQRLAVVKVSDPLAVGTVVVSDVAVGVAGQALANRLTSASVRLGGQGASARLYAVSRSQASVAVVDAAGRTVGAWSGSVGPGEGNVALGSGTLSSGLYLWTARVGQTVVQGRVTVVR